jgi:hypothetical protein
LDWVVVLGPIGCSALPFSFNKIIIHQKKKFPQILYIVEAYRVFGSLIYFLCAGALPFSFNKIIIHKKNKNSSSNLVAFVKFLDFQHH